MQFPHFISHHPLLHAWILWINLLNTTGTTIGICLQGTGTNGMENSVLIGWNHQVLFHHSISHLVLCIAMAIAGVVRAILVILSKESTGVSSAAVHLVRGPPCYRHRRLWAVSSVERGFMICNKLPVWHAWIPHCPRVTASFKYSHLS